MKKITIVIFSIILFTSCQKKISSAEFEQNVFDEIFLKLVDSTYKDKRLYTFFPGKNKSFDDAEYLKQRQILENDTIGLVIAISNERKIHFEKFRSQKFIFKKLSEIQNEDFEYVKWTKKYPKFAGAMSFSKITFDKNLKNGKLAVSYSCGGKCGLGYNVFIKKEKEKWIITKVEQTWIS